MPAPARAVNEVNREACATAPKGSYAGANRQPKSDNATDARRRDRGKQGSRCGPTHSRQGDYAGDKVRRQQITPTSTAGARDRGLCPATRYLSSKSNSTDGDAQSTCCLKGVPSKAQNLGELERAASTIVGVKVWLGSARAGRTTQPRRSTR